MGEDADIQSTFGAGHVRFADLAPVAAVLAGVAGEPSALPLKLEPAWPVGIAVQFRPLVNDTITIGIPLQRSAVAR